MRTASRLFFYYLLALIAIVMTICAFGAIPEQIISQTSQNICILLRLCVACVITCCVCRSVIRWSKAVDRMVYDRIKEDAALLPLSWMSLIAPILVGLTLYAIVSIQFLN